MATTKVTTGGITDATIATADIANNAITAAKLASGVQTTINNNADNRVITGSGTANTLNAESNVVIDGSGQLGIGTTSPAAELHIKETGTGTGTGGIISETASGGGNAGYGFRTNGTDRYSITLLGSAGSESLRFRDEQNSAERMVIDSSGKLGIGTTSPNTLLHIRDTAIPQGYSSQSSTLLALEDSGDTSLEIGSGHNNTSSIFFGDTGANNKGQINYHNGTGGDAMSFHANGAERMRINSSGYLGINSDGNGPDRLLHVSQNNAGGVVTPFRLTNVAGTNGTEVRMEFECGLDEIAWIGAKNEGSDTGPLTFATASSQGAYPTEKMRLTKDGKVGIGTNDPQAMLHVYKVHHYVPTDSGKATGGIHVRGQHGNAGEYGGAISLSVGDGDASVAIAASQELADADVQGLAFFVHESSNVSDDAIEKMRLNNKGLFSCRGRAGSYITDQKSTEHHQFINSGNGQWCMQLKQEHHNGMNTQMLVNSVTNIEAFQIYSTSNNSTRFRVLNNGNCANANNSFGSLSDVKLKENIVDANSQWDDVKAVKVRNFNFKNDKDSKLLGVVAQEVETVSSGLVFETIDRDPDDSTKEIGTTKNVKYSILYMKAFKALQEAMTRIEALEAKVA